LSPSVWCPHEVRSALVSRRKCIVSGRLCPSIF
jgi:hypothetical protein